MKVAFFLLCLILPFSVQAISLNDFQTEMQNHLKKLPSFIHTSIQIEVLGAKKEVFSHDAEREMIPASSMKLITTAVALDTMGPGWKTTTNVYQDGSLKDGILTGNLIVAGEGDPYLVSERLWLLVRQLARRGIKKITGGIKIFNGKFSGNLDDLMNFHAEDARAFASMLSATSLNFNSLEIHIIPKPGEKYAHVELGPVPHDYAVIHGHVSMSSGSSDSIAIQSKGMEDGHEVFIISGSIGKDSEPTVQYRSILDPAAYFGHVFLAMLKEVGIETGAGFLGETNQSSGALIASLESLPLLDLVRLYNTYSNNFMAEQIFRLTGAYKYGFPATIEKAKKVTQEYFNQNNFCLKGVNIVNGSGLSWNARVNSRCYIDLLQKNYRDFRGFADLIGSLPAGGATGTLENRFRRGDMDPLRIRAKTGTLWSHQAVTSLVGFVPARTGQILVFSLLSNDERGGSERILNMRKWEDECVTLMEKLEMKEANGT